MEIKRILLVFYLLGLVSLFADMVYEGGRSVSGAFLGELGSPSIGPALIGFGEFAGYILRLLSGYIATVYQSSAIIWGFTVAGYVVTAVSIPMLAFASMWPIATALYIADRVGKGMRAPARDVVVAEVSEGMGIGKGFGIHELLDQLGAFAGPLMVALAVAYWGYRTAFLLLLIPGFLSIALVSSSAVLYPKLRSVGGAKTGFVGVRGLGKAFWLYVAASAALALGFMHWAIASYYLKSRNIMSDLEIGITYSIAMVVDAAVAVPLGTLFDRKGLRVLLITPPLSLLFIVMVLYAPRELLFLSAIPWGIVMCSEESIMRASVALLVKPQKRPMAFGTLGLVFGAFWALGGYIYSNFLAYPLYVTVYAVVTNVVALYMYIELAKASSIAHP